MKFGAAWYPEHWPEVRWPEDVAWMRKANMNVMRVGEFAWSTMEPREGKFEFGWLDRAIGLLDKASIDVVLGTPSAAPPAWLTQKYPETLNVDERGRLGVHGNRCHFKPLSRLYLKFCARIAGEMAKRYGRHKRVIGWQICNEYGHNSHDEYTRRRFQDWLRLKYRTLNNLNAKWSGAYWSEDYQDWSQIPIPVEGHNPGLRLEWSRFHAFTYRVYQSAQIREIRRHADRRQWITTNLMGWFGLFDHYEVTKDLDLASWDSYWGKGTPVPVDDALPHDLTRGFKRRNFWIMETQPSSVNWNEINTMHEPGRIRLRNWQAVAHGADAVLYWQWRNALGGQEQLHGSVIGADGKPRPCFDELAGLGAEFKKAAPYLEGTAPRAQVAFLNSYDSRWAIEFQRHHKDFDYVWHLREHYAPFFRRNVTVDVVSALEPVAKGVRLAVAPALWVLRDDTAAQLADFVRDGGHLVLTTRTGVKDWENTMRPTLAPGPLAPIAGIEVEDTYPLLDPVEVKGKGLIGKCKIWGERVRIRARDAEVRATFGPGCGWLEGRPAIVSRREGKGRVTCLAGWFDEKLLDLVMAEIMKEAGIKQRFAGPKGVEFAVRSGGRGTEILIIMNHTDKPAPITGIKGTDVLRNRSVRGRWILQPRDVAVVRLK